MVMTDPVADMLTRIRNGQQAKRFTVNIPASKYKQSILEVLKNEGYIAGYTVEKNEQGFEELKVTLKYVNGEPAIKEIKKKSKPGIREYSSISDLPKFYNGLGIAILSTSQGVMSDYEARQKNVGGEVICIVF